MKKLEISNEVKNETVVLKTFSFVLVLRKNAHTLSLVAPHIVTTDSRSATDSTRGLT